MDRAGWVVGTHRAAAAEGGVSVPIPGRKRLPDRKVLCGILFALHTGIAWEFLAQQLGFGSGMTCWRRLAEWHEAGVWRRLQELLLVELHAADKADWSKAVIDSSHLRALKGGPKPDRARSTAPGPEPRLDRPTVSAPRSDWESTSPADGSAWRPSAVRTRSRSALCIRLSVPSRFQVLK